MVYNFELIIKILQSFYKILIVFHVQKKLSTAGTFGWTFIIQKFNFLHFIYTLLKMHFLAYKHLKYFCCFFFRILKKKVKTIIRKLTQKHIFKKEVSKTNRNGGRILLFKSQINCLKT